MKAKVNGTSIHYEITGSGKTIILTHGLGGNSQRWETLVPALSRHYRVLTWDVRGHGQSDKPEGDYSAKLFASDLAALLKKEQIRSAFVLGHSMGGIIALRFVLDFPELCSALIVSSSTAEVNTQATKYFQDLAATVMEKGMDAIPTNPERNFSRSFIEKNPEAVAEFLKNRPVNDPGCYARSVLAISDYNYNKELANIHCPTLIMVGDQDVQANPGGSVKMSRLIPGSKLVIFKDCGHASYTEQPELFTRTVLDFLAGVSS